MMACITLCLVVIAFLIQLPKVFTTAIGAKPKQIAFVISGSDAFGGHADQWFHNPITDAIALTSQYFEPGSTEFGVLWTIPTKSEPEYKIVSAMQNKTSVLREELEIWLNSDLTRPSPSQWTGLRGSLEFVQQHLFSSAEADKTVVALTHMNIIPQEIDLFLTQNCTELLVSVIVFPWPWLDCKVKEMHLVLDAFNSKLGWSGYYSHDLAFCGRKQITIRELGSIIDAEMPNMRMSIADFCPAPPTFATTRFNWTAWEIMRRRNTTKPTTTTTTTLPTQLVIVQEVPENCASIWCHPWLKQVYFVGNIAIFSIVGLIVLRICCAVLPGSPAHAEYKLAMGLKIHSRYFYPMCYRIAIDMPGKKMKRAKSKGSIASRKSVARVKGTKESKQEKQRKKEALKAKLGSAFNEDI